ncbi:MAG: hydroxymethylpyrimidine/phosphomethylpyrimidine kinase [Myxococcales bacterium]|nr:hydroxymethylpyrimidine/phosphomethylpyrimidine kinase [Myxococcales bacterium]
MKIRAWAIGGFDPSGGAGVLADVMAFDALGVPAAALVTSLTAQNSREFLARRALPPAWLRRQAEGLLREGLPRVVKVGMLGSAAMAREVARLLEELDRVLLVLDPVLRASAGPPLLDGAGLRVLRDRLIPRATLLKPNRREAEVILGQRLPDTESVRRAAHALVRMGARAAIITTGDDAGRPRDFLVDASGEVTYAAPRIPVQARGTGCRFTSGIAAGLARGLSLRSAVVLARRTVRAYLRKTLLSRGRRFEP